MLSVHGCGVFTVVTGATGYEFKYIDMDNTATCCNIGYPSDAHLKFISGENSFVCNIRIICEFVLKNCTEHGSDTVMICIEIQNRLTIEP